MKPDVVFFGENVPAERVARCYEAVDALARTGGALLVAGSSLTVMSGLRFVRRAAKQGTSIVIVNRGATRGDEFATHRVAAGCSEFLTDLFTRTHLDACSLRIKMRYPGCVRTTVNLDADVLARVQQLQREGLGLSEAVNSLARRGMEHTRPDFVFTPIVFDVGVTVDVSNVGQALELLDDWDSADAARGHSTQIPHDPRRQHSDPCHRSGFPFPHTQRELVGSDTRMVISKSPFPFRPLGHSCGSLLIRALAGTR